MAEVVGKVHNVKGEVIAIGTAGERRILKDGDEVHRGETIRASKDGSVELTFTGGNDYMLAAGQMITLSDEVSGYAPTGQEEGALFTADCDINDILGTIENGGNLDSLLEATAAGYSSSGSSGGESGEGGHGSVSVGRLYESTTPVNHEFGSGTRKFVSDPNSPVGNNFDEPARSQPTPGSRGVDDSTYVQVNLQQGYLTNDNTPTLGGVAEPGSSLTIPPNRFSIW